jgi:hypothetical protein
MSLLGVCHWLQSTSWAVAIRESDLAFPFIEGTHILALSLSVGLVVVFDLRVLRLAFRDEPVSRIMKLLAPWSLAGFAIMLLTGGLLFMTQAEKAYGNTFFRAKFLLLLLAGINALVYQVKFYPNMTAWDTAPVAPAGARIIAVLSLLFWIGVIACGRTMAYEL